MGRPFNATTRLGQLMAEQGWSVIQLAIVSGVSERQISEYLSGRKAVSALHSWPLAEALGVNPSVIRDPSLVAAGSEWD